MSAADYGKIKCALLRAVQADVNREIFSDHTVGALPRARNILKLLCDIEVWEEE